MHCRNDAFNLLLDLCGFFVTLYEAPLAFKPGSLNRELILVLEDRSATGLVSWTVWRLIVVILLAKVLIVFISPDKIC